MIEAADFCKEAETGGYLGTPYEKLDCQAFVEAVLKGCGLVRNWRGSNHMWRDAVYGHAEKNSETILPGALVFTIKRDGGENKKYYKDGVNAAHVGIYIGGGVVMHSTTPGGVQYDDIMSERWTHTALLHDVRYVDSEIGLSDHDMIVAIYKKILEVFP